MIHRVARRAAGGLVLLVTTLGIHGSRAAWAQQAESPLQWQRGGGAVPIGSALAEIDLDADYLHLDAAGTRTLMELSQNPTSGDEVATIAPAAESAGWFVIFEWDESGYVKDDEAAELNPAAILESIRSGTEAANKERESKGWGRVEVVGWKEEPRYDAQTHNLTWAILGKSEQGESVNRNVRLLGRRGVMSATLVCDPAECDGASASVDQLLAGFRFLPGSTYAEFVSGKDKVATYGLTALVAGGAAGMAIKSGLLGKFWKLIVAGGVALLAGVRGLLGRRQSRDGIGGA